MKSKRTAGPVRIVLEQNEVQLVGVVPAASCVSIRNETLATELDPGQDLFEAKVLAPRGDFRLDVRDARSGDFVPWFKNSAMSEVSSVQLLDDGTLPPSFTLRGSPE